MHRQINPQTTCEFTADQVGMALAIIKGLPHHSPQRDSMVMDDPGFWHIYDFGPPSVDSCTQFVIRSSSGSPHTFFVKPVELHQVRASNCKICRNITSLPRRP